MEDFASYAQGWLAIREPMCVTAERMSHRPMPPKDPRIAMVMKHKTGGHLYDRVWLSPCGRKSNLLSRARFIRNARFHWRVCSKCLLVWFHRNLGEMEIE